MQAVKSKNTCAEIAVRKLLYAEGYRYRLHKPDLPGKPDLAFPSRKKVVFVHGCFWHRHTCRNGKRQPKTNLEYWIAKIARNVERDAAQLKETIEMGWQVLVIWECELKDETALKKRLISYLG